MGEYCKYTKTSALSESLSDVEGKEMDTVNFSSCGTVKQPAIQ